MPPDARELLKAYQDRLRELRRTSGIAGPLIAPLQLQAELIEAALQRQTELEERMSGAMERFGALLELARDAPATLRTQAKAFDAAAGSFRQAAEVMNLQADLIERTASALGAPTAVLRAMREREGTLPAAPPPDADSE